MNQNQTANPETKWAFVAEHPESIKTLSDGDAHALGCWLRDTYFALSVANRASGGDAQFRAIVAAWSPPPTLVLEGLSIYFHPTAGAKLVRFVDEEKIPLALRDKFARPSAQLPHLCAVFVDPEELSYRTYENILPLDRYFSHGSLDATLHDRKRLAKKGDRYSFRLQVSEDTQRRLLSLDKLGLYVAPLNSGSRGGDRFIFHAARLSEVLTSALRSALPKSLLKGFSHVNPVFRANRFAPGDRKFHLHYDSPYYDAAQKQHSRYTLLLYLTSGRGKPTLRIGDDVELEQIDAMTCVLFDQSFAHEGAPYEDGQKFFLRTELVYDCGKVAKDDKIGELFAKACYLTGESVFAPELSRFADDLYNRVARAHFAGLSDEERNAETQYVHKEFKGVHFVASGYDFWFAKGHLTLQECAAIALLDGFNCTISGTAFHKLCRTEVLPRRASETEWIPKLLHTWQKPAEPVFGTLDKGSLFPPPEEAGACCCPFHSISRFDATRCEDIIEFYDRAQSYAKKRVFAAPIVLMGQEMFLDAAQFVVEPGRIQVLSEQSPEPVNFAACWNFGGDPSNYVDVAQTVSVLQPLTPPILYVETSDCYHLMLDFFRNSWRLQSTKYDVPIPFISDIDPGAAEEGGKTPWLSAAKRGNAQRKNGKRGTEAGEGPWWGDTDSAVMAELYPKRKKDRDSD
ncbi:MAG: hypothetical protein U0787_03920 [Polyangia bacterium]